MSKNPFHYLEVLQNQYADLGGRGYACKAQSRKVAIAKRYFPSRALQPWCRYRHYNRLLCTPRYQKALRWEGSTRSRSFPASSALYFKAVFCFFSLQKPMPNGPCVKAWVWLRQKALTATRTASRPSKYKTRHRWGNQWRNAAACCLSELRLDVFLRPCLFVLS